MSPADVTPPPPAPAKICPYSADDLQLCRDQIASCKVTEELIQAAIRIGYPCDAELAECQAQCARATNILSEYGPAVPQ